VKIIIHPLFVLAIVLAVWAGFGFFVLACIVAVLIHEFSHAAAANYFGIRAKRLTLMPFGAQVNIDCAFLPRKQQIIILLAGAFGNIAAALAASSFMWMWPQFFTVLELFIMANASIAALNLIPIYPLDGGKVLSTPKSISYVAFGILFFIGCFVWFSWTFILLSVFMLFTVWVDTKSEFTTKLVKSMRIKNGPLREVAIRRDMTIFQVYKLVSHNSFTKFIITDMGNKEIFENQLENLLLTHRLDTKIVNIYI